MTASSPWFISALPSGFPAEREQGKLASVRRAGSYLSDKAAITRPSEAAWPKESWMNQPVGFIDGHRWLYLSGCFLCKFPANLLILMGLSSSVPNGWRSILGGCCPAWSIAFELLGPAGLCLWRPSGLFVTAMETFWRLLGSGCMNGPGGC